eukprot:TRINITY_DN90925_c0_g1_i1.p1 TRINITY_DN90925_c0_g1~~TRINITY_DN90925_c0_g1_i1.p1  ORF type:complete len:289 (+),score=41.22 TRINITY_DN90925_c0_g1_i1:149-1015(+)
MNTYRSLIVFLILNVAAAETCVASSGDVDSLLDSAVVQLSMFAAGWLMFYGVKHRWIKPASQPEGLKAHELSLPSASPLRSERNVDQVGAAQDTSKDSFEEAELDFPLIRTPTCKNDAPSSSTSEQSSIELLLLQGLAKVLQTKLAPDAEPKLRPWRRTCFHGKDTETPPNFEDYLAKLHWFFECSGSAFVVALIYLDRLCKAHSSLQFTDSTCHRLMLGCLVVALKYHDDEYPYKNSWYADIGDIPIHVLNDMELQVCRLLDWKLFVQTEEYERFYEEVVSAQVETD